MMLQDEYLDGLRLKLWESLGTRQEGLNVSYIIYPIYPIKYLMQLTVHKLCFLKTTAILRHESQQLYATLFWNSRFLHKWYPDDEMT